MVPTKVPNIRRLSKWSTMRFVKWASGVLFFVEPKSKNTLCSCHRSNDVHAFITDGDSHFHRLRGDCVVSFVN